MNRDNSQTTAYAGLAGAVSGAITGTVYHLLQPAPPLSQEDWGIVTTVIDGAQQAAIALLVFVSLALLGLFLGKELPATSFRRVQHHYHQRQRFRRRCRRRATRSIGLRAARKRSRSREPLTGYQQTPRRPLTSQVLQASA